MRDSRRQEKCSLTYGPLNKKLTSPDPNSPGHFQYQIEDPQAEGATIPCGPSPCTLDKAGYQLRCASCTLDGVTDFAIRGVVKDPTGDLSGLNMSVGSNADIQVTDSNGLMAGPDPVTGSILEQIPGSVYWRDSQRNEETGADDTGIAHSVLISTPAPGAYQLRITGTALGAYTLSVRAYSQDGTAQPATSVLGIAGPGSSSSVQFQFASTPGSTSIVTSAATYASTLQDISNSLQLGLIDNQGISNSLSSKIKAASVAAGGGDNTTAANVLRAFTNEVNAQIGKHITGIAPQVLLADATYLISQLR